MADRVEKAYDGAIVEQWQGIDYEEIRKPSAASGSGYAHKESSWSDWLVDKLWGKAEAKADAMIADAGSQGWFTGFWGKVTLVFWLIVGGLVAFIALCVMGTINRILGRGN